MLISGGASTPYAAGYVLVIGKQTCGGGGIFDHVQYCGAKGKQPRSQNHRQIPDVRGRLLGAQSRQPRFGEAVNQISSENPAPDIEKHLPRIPGFRNTG
jgi:hypothetical protein